MHQQPFPHSHCQSFTTNLRFLLDKPSKGLLHGSLKSIRISLELNVDADVSLGRVVDHIHHLSLNGFLEHCLVRWAPMFQQPFCKTVNKTLPNVSKQTTKQLPCFNGLLVQLTTEQFLTVKTETQIVSTAFL